MVCCARVAIIVFSSELLQAVGKRDRPRQEPHPAWLVAWHSLTGKQDNGRGVPLFLRVRNLLRVHGILDDAHARLLKNPIFNVAAVAPWFRRLAISNHPLSYPHAPVVIFSQ
jgi:hypothetical protein